MTADLLDEHFDVVFEGSVEQARKAHGGADLLRGGVALGEVWVQTYRRIGTA